MAKFIYRLQNILDIKNKMENQAKSAYSAARQKLNEEQKKLEDMLAHKRELENAYRELATGILNPQEMLDTRKAIDYQRELIKGQLVEIRVAEKNFEMARIRLNEAIKDRKTHEKLREKAFEEFLMELSQEENKEIDQLVSYRYSADKE